MAEPKDFRTVEFKILSSSAFPLHMQARPAPPAFGAVLTALHRPCHFHTRSFIADIENAIEDSATVDNHDRLFLGAAGMEKLGALWYEAAPNADTSGVYPDHLIARYFRLCGYVVGFGHWIRYRANMCVSWEYPVLLDIYNDKVRDKPLT